MGSGRMLHMGQYFVPIFVQPMNEQGPAYWLFGFEGHPIYGREKPKGLLSRDDL